MNYHLELEKLLSGLKTKDIPCRLLLHSCCAPCSSYVLTYLMEFFDITVLYYNPNIYPEEEYKKRMSEQSRLIEELNSGQDMEYVLNDATVIKHRKKEIKLICADYDHEVYLDRVKGLEHEAEGGKRCEECFSLRLEQTEKIASENGFDYFGTTLTVSPHKNAVVINDIGNDIYAENNKSIFLLSDFKKKEGYKISIELSKDYNLYRQDYCGCEFSMHHQ